MSESSAQKPRKPSRLAFYGAALAVGVVVLLAGWYQEELGYFFRLRTWDSQAPARVVTSFLEAGKQGDRQKADGFLGTEELKPLVENDRWLGYFLISQAGRMEFRWEDLVPAGDIGQPKTEFVFRGEGAAQVSVPDRAGKNVTYRLGMTSAGWKIVEIRGGRMGS